MTRANRRKPTPTRRRGVLIPLAVGMLISAGAIAALSPKARIHPGLAAFGGAPDCPRIEPRAAVSHITPGPADTAVSPGPTTPADPATPGTKPTGTATPDRGTATPDRGMTPTSTAAPDPATTTPRPDVTPSRRPGPDPCPTDDAPTRPSAAPSVPRGASPPAPQPSPTAPPAPNADCALIVPPNPLTAAGLATPYRLTATDPAMGTCTEANPNQSAFVQATIIDPVTGAVSVYNPLVVDAGARPAVAPVTPRLPAGAVVGIWFGFNGANLTLRDQDGSLRQGNCVNGLGDSVFGQFAHCNAPAFFAAANAAIRAGKLTVPPLGRARDGMSCPSVRDFSLVDQDQSDNVTTRYLLTGDGRTAQQTAANQAALAGARTLTNPSDNALLDAFVDPALGCTPWKAPDLADNGTPTTSLALNELQAAAHQTAPAALVPLNNPMTLVGGRPSADKTNAYRAGVDQPPLPAGQTPAIYCRSMSAIQAARLQRDRPLLAQAASPMPANATNLFTFLGMRLQQSFVKLGCQRFGLTNPVELTMRGDQVTDVTFTGAGGRSPGVETTR